MDSFVAGECHTLLPFYPSVMLCPARSENKKQLGSSSVLCPLYPMLPWPMASPLPSLPRSSVPSLSLPSNTPAILPLSPSCPTTVTSAAQRKARQVPFVVTPRFLCLSIVPSPLRLLVPPSHRRASLHPSSVHHRSVGCSKNVRVCQSHLRHRLRSKGCNHQMRLVLCRQRRVLLQGPNVRRSLPRSTVRRCQGPMRCRLGCECCNHQMRRVQRRRAGVLHTQDMRESRWQRQKGHLRSQLEPVRVHCQASCNQVQRLQTRWR